MYSTANKTSKPYNANSAACNNSLNAEKTNAPESTGAFSYTATPRPPEDPTMPTNRKTNVNGSLMTS